VKVLFTDDVPDFKYGGLYFGIRNRVKALESVGVETGLMGYEQMAQEYPEYDLIYSSNYFNWSKFTKNKPHLQDYPHIVELHGWVVPDILPYKNVGKETYDILKEEKNIITTSNKLGDKLREAELSCYSCHNSYDTERFQHTETKNSSLLINVANVSVPKGFDRLSKVAESFRTTVIGRTEVETNTICLEPYHKNIRYVGKIDHEKIYDELIKSSIFVHLSRFESCPLTITEAIGAGLPVVCTDAGDNKELVGDAGIVVKNPADWYYARLAYDRFRKCYLDKDKQEDITADVVSAIKTVKLDYDSYKKRVKEQAKKFHPQVIGEKLKEILSHI